MKVYRLLIGLLAMGCMSCQDDKAEVGGERISTDPSQVQFKAEADSALIKVMPTGEIKTSEGWGLQWATISENGKTEDLVNEFDTIVVNEHENYQVFKKELQGEWFFLQKRDDQIFVRVNANNGTERQVKVSILGYGGRGSFTVSQEGRGE